MVFRYNDYLICMNNFLIKYYVVVVVVDIVVATIGFNSGYFQQFAYLKIYLRLLLIMYEYNNCEN